MNSWANIGDLVFILGKDNEPVPCKVIKEIGTGNSTQLFFEVIEDNDRRKVPKKRLKCFITDVGWKGGFVFKEKQNAIDYLDAISNGEFNMSSIIAKKTKRVQEKMAKTNPSSINIQKIKEDATRDAVNQVHKVVIAAMLLALNTKLKIGPKRGAEIIEEINRLINETPKEELLKSAENKMKIKLDDNNG